MDYADSGGDGVGLVSFWEMESEHDVACPSYFAGN